MYRMPQSCADFGLVALGLCKIVVWEKAAVRLGQEVVKQVARAWLRHRRAVEQRESELVDLIAVGAVDRFHRRKLVRQLEDIGDQVALRLRPVLERECHGLSEDESRAVSVGCVQSKAVSRSPRLG